MICEVFIRPATLNEPQTTGTLSDEHAASSYGQPVLIMPDGRVLGPGEYAYTFSGNHPLIDRWNELALPIIDELAARNRAAFESVHGKPKPVDVSWLDEITE